MADVRKVLGQIAPVANVEGTLYTAPHSAIINIVATNRGNDDAWVAIRVAVADAAVNDKQFLARKMRIPGNDFISFTTLDIAGTDVVYCTASNANVTFQAFGNEATS